MKILRAWPVVLAVVVLALGFCWLVSGSESFQTCRGTGRALSKSPQAKDVKPAYEIYSECAASFLETPEGEGLITALAAFLTAVFTGTLYIATTEQGRLTREAIDESKLSSQRQLRAYVSAAPGKAFITDEKLGVIVQLKNTGTTPAFETRCLWQLNIGAKPGKGDFEYGFANPNDDPIPTFVLYPNSTHSSVRTILLSDSDKANVEAGSHVVRVFGIVFYTDAFHEEQTGKFYCYMDGAGYKMWLANFMAQPSEKRLPIEAPFKFTEGNNWASFN